MMNGGSRAPGKFFARFLFLYTLLMTNYRCYNNYYDEGDEEQWKQRMGGSSKGFPVPLIFHMDSSRLHMDSLPNLLRFSRESSGVQWSPCGVHSTPGVGVDSAHIWKYIFKL